MKTFIISRPNLNLVAIREIGKLTLNRDLSTNTKGNSEALAVYSLLVGGNEYVSTPMSQSLLDYTVAVVLPYWSVDNIRNFMYRLQIYTIETIKQDNNLLIIKGSLDAFVLLVKMLSIAQSPDDILEFVNSLQMSFEEDGLSRIFSDCIKEKKGSFWILRKK